MSDIIPTEAEPRPTPQLPFRRPADYYTAPPSEVRPLFPRWVPIGCGAASLLAIVILFGIGTIAGSAEGGTIFAAIFGTMQDEIDGMFTKDVTPPQKAAFDGEMKMLRGNLAAGKVSIDKLQPLLQEVRASSADSKVTPDEAAKLTTAAHVVNEGVAKPHAPATPK